MKYAKNNYSIELAKYPVYAVLHFPLFNVHYSFL